MDDLVTSLPVNLSRLAREIAMDILPIGELLGLHQIDAATWHSIQTNPQFQAMMTDMIAEWNSAGNVQARVRVKAATGIESLIEIYVRDIADGTIPLNQRVEAGKLLAKLGELIDKPEIGGNAGERVNIQIYVQGDKQPMIIDAVPVQLDVE